MNETATNIEVKPKIFMWDIIQNTNHNLIEMSFGINNKIEIPYNMDMKIKQNI